MTMSTTLPPSSFTTASLQREGRFWLDVTLPTCGNLRCNGNGVCVTRDAAEGCDCRLGYTGQFCRDTVNEAVSVSLLLGVLAVIFGIIAAAFIFAKLRQKRKAQLRKATDQERERMKLEGEWA
ncbi:neurogenic locus notch homolog protein 3-like isoform X2 [Alosa sapidissima]|nr:neurogenic locus notch homolog protein 3-like isoform X2 [Alosa sapidissima]XP_041937356.1 neurogenic locus notch homolog protein 3-like isoform X2 [Alosa sapidissima]